MSKVSADEIANIQESMFKLDTRKAIATGIIDLFALGCWLHANGNTTAGYKSVQTAMEAAGIDKTNKILFVKVLQNLKGNETSFAKQIGAHQEVSELWNKA